MIGTAMRQALVLQGYRVIILTRNPAAGQPEEGVTYARWDVEKQEADEQAIAAADHIIHLAGAGVADKRWTATRKAEIVQSRTRSTQLLTDILLRIPNKVKSFVSASATGWYGADPTVPNPNPFTEDAPAENSFLGNTCREWEAASAAIAAAGIRTVKLRIGVVLSPAGGLQKAFTQPMKWGIAAILGGGRQMISWIHVYDLVQLFIKATTDENMQGAYNAVAPNPVDHRSLVLMLARSRRRFFIPVPVPAFMVRFIAGELSTEVLKSATVSAAKTVATGFAFRYPVLTPELFGKAG